jgi:hypothetical protein
VFAEDGEEELEIVVPALVCKPRLSRLVSKAYEHHTVPPPAETSPGRHASRGVSSVLSLHFDLMTTTPLRRKYASVEALETESNGTAADDSEQNGYNLSALYFLSINYVLGVGCLGVPYAFAKAGWLLASCLVIFVSVLSYITVMWVAETCVRADILQQQQQRHHLCQEDVPEKESQRTSRWPTKVQDDQHQNETSSLLMGPQHSQISDNDTTSSLAEYEPTARERYSYEVTDLIALFLGPVHYKLYQMSLLALMYIGLLAYTQVFVGSIVAIFYGGADQTTWTQEVVPLICFAALAVPLACSELEEQLSLQALLSAFRFAAILVMVVGSVIAILMTRCEGGSSEEPQLENDDMFSPQSPAAEKASNNLADFSGFGIAFSTALFSQLFQHSIPGLIRPLSEHPQQTRRKIPVSSIILSSSIRYGVISCARLSHNKYYRCSISVRFGRMSVYDVFVVSSLGINSVILLSRGYQLVRQFKFHQFLLWHGFFTGIETYELLHQGYQLHRCTLSSTGHAQCLSFSGNYPGEQLILKCFIERRAHDRTVAARR